MEPDPSSPSGDPTLDPAVPSSGARILAFLAICVAGLCGGLIGWAVTDLQTDGSLAPAIGGLVGAVAAAGGVAIVAVLALRAMTEWRTVDNRRNRGSTTGSG